MSKIFSESELKEASNRELAEFILDKSDGRPLGNAFSASSAIELAKRITGGVELDILPSPSRNLSQAKAPNRDTKVSKGGIYGI